MFGKSLSEYVAFQKPILILIAAVWAVRLALSMAGVPVAGAQVVSVTGVLVLGALYYGWAVGRKGFGSFKQLYGLNLVQGVFSQTLVALAIVLAMALGQDNIYTTPSSIAPQGIGVLGLPPPDGRTWRHAIGRRSGRRHRLPIIGWLLGSLVLLATRRQPNARPLPDRANPSRSSGQRARTRDNPRAPPIVRASTFERRGCGALFRE
jgi:hypothetical protein